MNGTTALLFSRVPFPSAGAILGHTRREHQCKGCQRQQYVHASQLTRVVWRGAPANVDVIAAPLHYATKRNKKDAVQMLLSVAAAHDIENRDGEPPLTVRTSSVTPSLFAFCSRGLPHSHASLLC